MKTITKISAIAILMIGFYSNSFAQASANASATATIITPIAITKNTDMNFGNIAATSIAGTVSLVVGNTRTTTGGVTLPTGGNAGTVTVASYSVTGEGAYTYAITIPAGNVTLFHTNGTDFMLANGFFSFPATTGALTAGAQTLKVGATLNVGASQLSGVYATSNGAGVPFAVTVNYN